MGVLQMDYTKKLDEFLGQFPYEKDLVEHYRKNGQTDQEIWEFLESFY